MTQKYPISVPHQLHTQASLDPDTFIRELKNDNFALILLNSKTTNSTMANGFLPYHEPGSVYPSTSQLSLTHFLTDPSQPFKS